MTSNPPAWLPNLVSLTGQLDDYLEMLHGIFTVDISEANLMFQGMPVRWNRRIREGKWEETFWHIVSKDVGTTGQ